MIMRSKRFRVIRVSDLDWFHTMIWNEAIAQVEYLEGEDLSDLRKLLERRFLELRGYLPWNHPELMPDLGEKLWRVYWEIVDDGADLLIHGNVKLEY